MLKLLLRTCISGLRSRLGLAIENLQPSAQDWAAADQVGRSRARGCRFHSQTASPLGPVPVGAVWGRSAVPVEGHLARRLSRGIVFAAKPLRLPGLSPKPPTRDRSP